MVGIVQLVRAPDCGSGGRGFEPHLPPAKERLKSLSFFVLQNILFCPKLTFQTFVLFNQFIAANKNLFAIIH